MYVPPPESPWDVDENGFSTQYGASASSPPGRSDHEVGEDWFVSARGGEETEVEMDKRGKRLSSMQEKDRQPSSDGLSSLRDGGLLRRNKSDPTLPDGT